MKNKKIAVLFGGHSSEYEVSLQSAHAVLEHIDAKIYEAIPIGITKDGEWYRYTGEISNIAAGTWREDAAHLHDVVFSQNRSVKGFWENDGGWQMRRIDLAFPVLHGKNGEDGTVQGMLELAGIPIVGCGTLCSALCMDKDRAHRLVSLAGVRVPKAVAFQKARAASAINEIDRTLRYPIFVKPLRGGSSIGMTKVNAKSELEDAVRLALSYDSEAIAEEAVEGFEVGCAVMGIGELTVGRADEIELSHGFLILRKNTRSKRRAFTCPRGSIRRLRRGFWKRRKSSIARLGVRALRAWTCSCGPTANSSSTRSTPSRALRRTAAFPT